MYSKVNQVIIETLLFETYAIDYIDEAQTQLESIFRIGFDDGFRYISAK